MPVQTPTKTDSVDVITHQSVVHPTTVVSSWIDCRTKKAAVIFMYHGFVEAAANTNSGKFIVQIRPDTGEGAATEHAISVYEFLTNTGTPDTEAMTATEPVADTSLAVASTTGFTLTAPDNQLYLQDTAVLANSEWAEMKTFTANTNIQLMSGLTNQKDNTSVIWNDASRFICALNLDSVESFRVVWTHEGTTGTNGHIKVIAVTYDSDTSV